MPVEVDYTASQTVRASPHISTVNDLVDIGPFQVHGVVPIVLIVCLLIVTYLIPSIIAFARNHYCKNHIACLNFFLGLTGIGWLAALVWSAADATAYGVGGKRNRKLMEWLWRVMPDWPKPPDSSGERRTWLESRPPRT